MSDTMITMKDGGERAGDNHCKEELVWVQQQQQQLISRTKGKKDGWGTDIHGLRRSRF